MFCNEIEARFFSSMNILNPTLVVVVVDDDKEPNAMTENNELVVVYS
jgi:hypothetical protein